MEDSLFPPADLVRYVDGVRAEAEKSILASIRVDDNILKDVKVIDTDRGQTWTIVFMLNGKREEIRVKPDALGYSKAWSVEYIAYRIGEVVTRAVLEHYRSKAIS